MYMSNLTIVPLLLFVLFYNWTASGFEVTGLPVRDCSDEEKVPIANRTECERAASSLGFTFNDAGSWSHNPKGCYLRYGTRVFLEYSQDW